MREEREIGGGRSRGDARTRRRRRKVKEVGRAVEGRERAVE